ncbi:stress responsive A/B barrel domain protein [Xylaria bambusicola]|uniref:stress responsive A/B barrel domain protein n=1 Tax=Xylaria bambusicola TaxID=326684 RepID=UPI00200764C4|nr:stress responsive A/B barrel domain protein [Xylaria bambusicola]KAI0506252.1 stress responsive A/B barrel domain protein [Xylaria bambusicola]
MTLIHIVLFRFQPWVTQEQGEAFLRECKSLKNLSCIKDGRLFVGGPTLTDPIELSKGLRYALVSYHENLAALNEYQVAKEASRYVGTLLVAAYLAFAVVLRLTNDLPGDSDRLPYKDDPLDYETLCRFDFEVPPEDEYMCGFGPLGKILGN